MDFYSSCTVWFKVACSAASAARLAAVRRFSASYGVSPGRIKVVPSGTGSLPPPPMGKGFGLTGVSADDGDRAVSSVVEIPNGVAASAGFLALFRRFCGLVPNCCCNQRRIVSRPISMPISCNPAASASTDSPACRRRIKSALCGSNWAVAWLRGCRAWATAWASVVGRMGTIGSCVRSDMVTVGERYVWWSGSATGAPQAHSKRQRLDVGVLPYLFLFVFGGYFGGQIGGASVVKSLVSLLTGFLSFLGQVESALDLVLRFTLSYKRWFIPEWVLVSKRGVGC